LNSKYGIEFIILSNLIKFLWISEVQTRFVLKYEFIRMENQKPHVASGCNYRNQAQPVVMQPSPLGHFGPRVEETEESIFPFPAGDLQQKSDWLVAGGRWGTGWGPCPRDGEMIWGVRSGGAHRRWWAAVVNSGGGRSLPAAGTTGHRCRVSAIGGPIQAAEAYDGVGSAGEWRTMPGVEAVPSLGLDGDEQTWWWLAMTNRDGGNGSESRGKRWAPGEGEKGVGDFSIGGARVWGKGGGKMVGVG
jgi:hypothetical protein